MRPRKEMQLGNSNQRSTEYYWIFASHAQSICAGRRSAIAEAAVGHPVLVGAIGRELDLPGKYYGIERGDRTIVRGLVLSVDVFGPSGCRFDLRRSVCCVRMRASVEHAESKESPGGARRVRVVLHVAGGACFRRRAPGAATDRRVGQVAHRHQRRLLGARASRRCWPRGCIGCTDWPGRRSSGESAWRMRESSAPAVIAMALMHAQDPRKWYAVGPKEGEEYFQPSLARTVSGDFIPAETLMMDYYCQKCHPDVHAGWSASVHHFSSFNNAAYLASVKETRDVSLKRDGSVKASRWCAGCHDPVPFFQRRVRRSEVRPAASSDVAGRASPAPFATRSRT